MSALQAPLFTESELRELYEQQRLSLRTIAQQKGCHSETVRQHLIRYSISRRGLSESKVKYPRKPFSGNPIEQAYLSGFAAGDLHVHLANYSATSQTVVVACTSTVSEQNELVRSLFESYGHINISVSSKQTVTTCFLDLSFGFLLNRDDEIAAWIVRDPSGFAAYFAGYIDAEGSIIIKKRTDAAEAVIRSYDRNILKTCWEILQQLDIVCPEVGLAKRKGERDINGPIYHQDYWRLGIYRKRSLMKLFELIGPYLKHPLRRQQMKLAWTNVRARTPIQRSLNAE